MAKNAASKSIEELMAEADDLFREIHSEAIEDMREEHRLQLEKHAQHFHRIKSEAQANIDKKAASEKHSSAEGMHEAILDIVKAMHNFKKNLFKT
jgi:hypothetical protein